MSLQAEVLSKLQEAGTVWAARFQSEATVALEFASRLRQATSVPAALELYQEWAAHLTDVMAKDRELFTEQLQTFADMYSRAFAEASEPANEDHPAAPQPIAPAA
jgi:hypothetical protein